jgi:hypothetical protein
VVRERGYAGAGVLSRSGGFLYSFKPFYTYFFLGLRLSEAKNRCNRSIHIKSLNIFSGCVLAFVRVMAKKEGCRIIAFLGIKLDGEKHQQGWKQG